MTKRTENLKNRFNQNVKQKLQLHIILMSYKVLKQKYNFSIFYKVFDLVVFLIWLSKFFYPSSLGTTIMINVKLIK